MPDPVPLPGRRWWSSLNSRHRYRSAGCWRGQWLTCPPDPDKENARPQWLGWLTPWRFAGAALDLAIGHLLPLGGREIDHAALTVSLAADRRIAHPGLETAAAPAPHRADQ